MKSIFSLEKVTAIFLSKDLDPVKAAIDYYVEQDGCLILNLSESRIMGAMPIVHVSESDAISSVWKNRAEYDLVAILKSSGDTLLRPWSFSNPFEGAAVFVAQANIASMEKDTELSDRRVTEKKTMTIECGKRWEADSKDGEEFFAKIKQIRREIKLGEAGI